MSQAPDNATQQSPMADSARALIGMGLSRESVAAELRNHGASTAFLEFQFAAIWRTLQTPGDVRDDETNSEAAAVVPLAPERKRYLQFARSILPADALEDGRIVVPVELARLVWLFAAAPLEHHVVGIGEQTINVGGTAASGETYPALRTSHLMVLVALFVEAQRGGMEYVKDGSRVHLRVRTSYGRLLRLLYPDSIVGGSGVRRLRQQLEALRDTPVISSVPGSKSRLDQRFIESISLDGDRLEVLLGDRWTRPFLEDEQALADAKEGAARQTKPLLFNALRDIPGAIAKLTYVHMDWVLGHHTDKPAHLAYSTLLERTGSLSESRATAAALRSSRARRASRLDGLAALIGAPLSNGHTLHLAFAETRDGDRSDYKVIGTTASEHVGDTAAVEAIKVNRWVEWLERWHTTPTAHRRGAGRYRPALLAQARLVA